MRLNINNIKTVIKNNLCISCGNCVVSANSPTIKMKYNKRKFIDTPVPEDAEELSSYGKEFQVCPGKGMDLIQYSKEIASEESNFDPDLGYVNFYSSIRSTDEEILKNASSGGIIPAIALHLLTSGRVEGVITTKTVYSKYGPRTESFIATSKQQLLDSQGSIYSAASTNLALLKLGDFKGRVAFIGTPCQIEGVRMLQNQDEFYRKKIRYVIGNFCGGIKDNRAIDTIIRRHGFDASQIVKFRYRGGGQPGSMLIEDATGKTKERKYPDYSNDTGYKKMLRCRLCVNATNELADFACGDAWIPRLLESKMAWSIIMTRNNKATKIVKEMLDQDKIIALDLSLAEIKESQRSNLTSKKYRQKSRRAFYSMLNQPLPEYNGSFHDISTGIFKEVKIHFIYKISEIFERIRIYKFVINFVRFMRRRNEIISL